MTNYWHGSFFWRIEQRFVSWEQQNGWGTSRITGSCFGNFFFNQVGNIITSIDDIDLMEPTTRKVGSMPTLTPGKTGSRSGRTGSNSRQCKSKTPMSCLFLFYRNTDFTCMTRIEFHKLLEFQFTNWIESCWRVLHRFRTTFENCGLLICCKLMRFRISIEIRSYKCEVKKGKALKKSKTCFGSMRMTSLPEHKN